MEPYLFISYSHRDQAQMLELKSLLEKNHIRFWYDNGLHSGDDWNMVIARQLENASLCLLLLSQNSATSDYVKNELNFAMNHRIPIHSLLLHEFKMPSDIELMLGRIQMVEMIGNYEENLLKAFPPELFSSSFESLNATQENAEKHPLYTIENELLERQGTKTYIGKHKQLRYNCSVQVDSFKTSHTADLWEQAILASCISHPLFPKIYDVVIKNNQIWTYQEYRKEVFLDQFLKEHKLSEDTILSWTNAIIDAMEYLFKRNLAVRDFARGSMFVINNEQIGMSRLQNLYYGVFKLQPDNKQYYFENTVQEIAILLYQLTTGETPVLPLRIIKESHLRKDFMNKINLVIQKCTKEQGKMQYTNFSQLKEDLNATGVHFSDMLFLKQRQKKLEQYEQAKRQNVQKFTPDTLSVLPLSPPNLSENLEEEFGFDSTVVLSESVEEENVQIQLQICSTGQVLKFSKPAVTIGRFHECDMVLNQPAISRYHTQVLKLSNDLYSIEDLGTSNGTYILRSETKSERVSRNQKISVPKGTIMVVADVKIRIL